MPTYIHLALYIMLVFCPPPPLPKTSKNKYIDIEQDQESKKPKDLEMADPTEGCHL